MNHLALAKNNLPVIDQEGSLRRYLHEIRLFPMLSVERERELGRRLRDHNEASAARELITSHLRLVPKIAMKFRGYGLPLADVISEGNIGLMKAVRRFDPDKGFRLATYAMWWIRASIQEYVLASTSIVKFGSTATQKRLFFGLRRAKERIKAYGSYLSGQQAAALAQDFSVDEGTVHEMNGRLSGADQSLNAPLAVEAEGSGGEVIDTIADGRVLADVQLQERDEAATKSALLREAMASLKDRERDIVAARHLSEPAITLEKLSQKYGVSRERIRQIENSAINKLRRLVASSSCVPGGAG